MHTSDYIITSKHYLVLFVCAFSSGIYLSVRFGILVSLIFVSALSLLGIAVSLVAKYKCHRKHKPVILSLALTLAALLGIFRIYCADYVYSFELRQLKGQEIWLCGTVSSTPQVTSSGYNLGFSVDVFGISDKSGSFGTIMMYTPFNAELDLSAGDNIYAWTKLESPEGGEVFGFSDYYTHLKGKNIFITATTKNINHLPSGRPLTPVSALKFSGVWVRDRVLYAVDMMFPEDAVLNVILKGILIGDKSGFDDELFQKFSYAGISHIVAVSGLHMSILFSLLMIVSKGLLLSKRFNLLVSVPAILLFVSASAFTPSVCRAAVMILIMICATLLREEYNPSTSLFAALGAILAVTPYALFSKSLVLSFSATFGIFVYFPYLHGGLLGFLDMPRLKLAKCKPLRKGFAYISSSLALSLSTLISTGYFLAMYFGSISKVQFLTNLWTIPLVSVIFCLGYISCILYYLSPWIVSNILKYPLGLCLDIIKLTTDKFGVAENALNVPAQYISSTTAILYFGTALIIYMLLKNIRDIIADKKKAAYDEHFKEQ